MYYILLNTIHTSKNFPLRITFSLTTLIGRRSSPSFSRTFSFGVNSLDISFVSSIKGVAVCECSSHKRDALPGVFRQPKKIISVL